jgi:three-Cys-motif partner protein
MAEYISGPDGLIAQKDLGSWTLEKHEILRKYVGIASGPRQGFLRPLKPGLTPAGGVYIDLYCATGLGQLKDTKEFIDGSAVVAWKESFAKKAPFSKVIIGDAHEESLRACEARLRAAGCTNIIALHGTSDENVF